ncbi:MAG: POTRA domain-containing protein [Halioglobus sp.]|nr:POTRA domain-containing protein [Halioglobus sp.]
MPALANAGGLSYELTGLDGALRRNALAWLGEAPDTEAERQNFVASARQRVSKSLQALGYYRPAIDIEINREQPQWRMTIQVDARQPVRIREFDMRIDGAGRVRSAVRNCSPTPVSPAATSCTTATTRSCATGCCPWRSSADLSTPRSAAAG